MTKNDRQQTDHWRPYDVHSQVQSSLIAVGDLVTQVHRARNKLMLVLVHDVPPAARGLILEAMELLGEDPEFVAKEHARRTP